MPNRSQMAIVIYAKHCKTVITKQQKVFSFADESHSYQNGSPTALGEQFVWTRHAADTAKKGSRLPKN
jgi:hypothetical protein